MGFCIVGAGIAGIACARVLARAGHDVVVLDRSPVPGGRMASRRLDGRDVDLGASYLTARDDRFLRQVEDWTGRGLARAWTDTLAVLPGGRASTGPVRYGAAGGLRSLVQDLAQGLDVRQQVRVERVGPGPTVDGTPYDTVVLAMPDPQALAVLDPSLAEERAAIEGRAWEPALVLAARFEQRTWELDGAFVNGDDILSWVADDGSRRGDGAPVLVAHSTPSFAAAHLADPAAAGPAMVRALQRLLDLPPPRSTFVQRWTYAKPVGERDAPHLLTPAGVGLCGDGWGASKVEAAYLSGLTLGERLLGRPAGAGPGAGGC